MDDTHNAGSGYWTRRAMLLAVVSGVLLVGVVSVTSLVYGQRGAEPGALVLENDHVIVRRYLLQPGLVTGMHTHARDYLRVILRGGTVEITALNGAKRTETVGTGDVAWRSKEAHDTRNIGGGPIEGLVIEIK
jgi:quercetin dioxygenase-like cupin family protein